MNKSLENVLRINPEWARLPLFDRKGWKRYRFDEIAENIRESVMPTPTDSAMYVGLEHMDSGSLHVRRWGSEADLIGQKLRMRKGDILFARRNAYLRRVAIAPHDGLLARERLRFSARVEREHPVRAVGGPQRARDAAASRLGWVGADMRGLRVSERRV